MVEAHATALSVTGYLLSHHVAVRKTEQKVRGLTVTVFVSHKIAQQP